MTIVEICGTRTIEGILEIQLEKASVGAPPGRPAGPVARELRLDYGGLGCSTGPGPEKGLPAGTAGLRDTASKYCNSDHWQTMIIAHVP